MNFILIIGIFESLFLILLLAAKKNKRLPDFFLGTVILLFAGSIFLTYMEIYNIQNNFPYPHFLNISWLLLFLHGPSLWFYIKSFSNIKFKFKFVYLLHFLPFIGFFVVFYFDFLQLPAASKIEIVLTESFKEGNLYKISVLCIGISTISYNLWGLRLIQLHRRNLMNSLSKIEDYDLNWLRILIIASLSVYFINVSLFNLDLIFQFSSYSFLMLLAYSFASIYILVLGFFGLQQKNIFINHIPEFELSNQTELKTGYRNVPTESDNAIIHKILLYMNENQPFLDPEITLTKLSNLLHLKPEQLSTILNVHLEQSFFDFINKYRIEEFKIQSIAEKNKHLSIMGIAYDCGFNSKAAFYRAFKKFEGISPSEYIQKSH